MIYLVDIDGTLADCSHRLHYIQNKPANWDAFFDSCEDDAPIHDVIHTVNALEQFGATILLVSGRSDICLPKTRRWLLRQGVRFDAIYMRKQGDHREDSIVKAELLDQIRSEWKGFEITGVFEDRKQVVDMYRSKGLRVFQVAEGNF